MPEFFFTAILVVITLGVAIFFSKFIYYMCLANFIRIIVGIILTLSFLFFLSMGEWKIAGGICICSLEFIRRFFVYTQSEQYKRHSKFTSNAIGVILSPIAFTLKGGIKLSKYAIQVVDGTISEKIKLKRERAEFEYEKANFKAKEKEMNEEWENIKKAWDELIKEREEFERQKDGESSYEKKDYSQNEGYRKSSSKTNTNQQERNKKSTGRYFKEWEKFDLGDFEKNDPYEVLGCNRNDSKDTLKKAYKKLMMKWHSDTLGADKTASADKCREGKAIAQLINWSKDKLGLK